MVSHLLILAVSDLLSLLRRPSWQIHDWTGWTQVDEIQSKYVDLDLMPTIIKVVHQGGIWLDSRMLSLVLGLFSAELPHNSEQQHIILTPKEIYLLEKTNKQQWVDTLLGNTSELVAQQEAVHRLIAKLVQDDRVQQAAKALKAVYGPKHRQALLEQPLLQRQEL